jgi:hypothetical protein
MNKVSVIPQDEPAQAQLPTAVTPMSLLQSAVASGNLDLAEKLMGLQERWEKNQARKAFDEAMASAKAKIPNITKNREVDFTSAKGRTNYRYEDLGNIAKTVGPILAEHGLSYRYRATSNVNEPVSVTCIISHRDGHFEEITLTAGRDETGNKNSIQAVGSTITYLQRMTLKAALGLAVSNDDDGKTSEAASKPLVTQEQADKIRDALEASGKDRKKFLKWVAQATPGAEKIEDIPAELYQSCLDAANFKPAAQQ